MRDILFWSGGKDAFLALRSYQDISNRDPVLLTTYDDESGSVPHQNIPVERIQQQALSLGLILFTVPLSHPATNEEYLSAVYRAIRSVPFDTGRLIFGDLHLEEIREWREQQFEGIGYECSFPIWQKPAGELMDCLESEPVSVRISSVMEEWQEAIKPETLFNRDFIRTLPDEVDPFGERGEFHTEVIFTSSQDL